MKTEEVLSETKGEDEDCDVACPQEGHKPACDLLFQSACWGLTERTPLSQGRRTRERACWVCGPGQAGGQTSQQKGHPGLLFPPPTFLATRKALWCVNLFQPTAGLRGEGRRARCRPVELAEMLPSTKTDLWGVNSLIKLILTGCPLSSLFTKTTCAVAVTTGESRAPQED